MEGDVVKTFAPLFEVLAHGRVRAGGFQKLYLRLPHSEHRGDDALLLDFLGFAHPRAEVLLVEAGGGGDVFDGVAEVVDLFEQGLSSCQINCRSRMPGIHRGSRGLWARIRRL